MAENFWTANSEVLVMDKHIQSLIDECKRQEISCLYTSTNLFEWLKWMRWCRISFVIIPIILGGIATSTLFGQQYGWITSLSGLLAGLFPGIYKALNWDINIEEIAKYASQYKGLQDSFRQARCITSLGSMRISRISFMI
jgi:hypothetical protein